MKAKKEHEQQELKEDYWKRIQYIADEYGQGYEDELFDEIIELLESLGHYEDENQKTPPPDLSNISFLQSS